MRFTSTTVILGFIAAAYAIPVDLDSSASSLATESHQVRASSYDPTAALFLPRDESSLECHPSTRGLKFFMAPLEITYDHEGQQLNDEHYSAEKYLQKAKELLKAAASELGMGHESHPFDNVKATNEWQGSWHYVVFTIELPICKGKCKAKAWGTDKGEIHAQDGKELYQKME